MTEPQECVLVTVIFPNGDDCSFNLVLGGNEDRALADKPFEVKFGHLCLNLFSNRKKLAIHDPDHWKVANYNLRVVGEYPASPQFSFERLIAFIEKCGWAVAEQPVTR